MTPNEYQNLAVRTVCDQQRALQRMEAYNPQYERSEVMAIQLNHAVMGIGGEQGELCTALQRWIYYGKEFDAINFEEELGDVLWYVAEACDALGVNMENIMCKNIAKLRARYPDKYTDERAAEENRDRAAERQVLESSIPAAVFDAVCETGQTLGEALAQEDAEQSYYTRVTGPKPKMPECPACRTPLSDKTHRCPNCGKAV